MGIIENVGASKRSVSGVYAMGMIMITIVAIGYMIMDEIKRRKEK